VIKDGVAADPVRLHRQDGTAVSVNRTAEIVEDEPLLADTPVVLQVSRWDAPRIPVAS
jgi:hypothetical protein